MRGWPCRGAGVAAEDIRAHDPPPCPLWNPVVTHLHGNWHRLTGVVRGREQACSPVPIRAPAVRSFDDLLLGGNLVRRRETLSRTHRGGHWARRTHGVPCPPNA